VLSVLIYKTKWFNRWAKKEGLNTASLCLAVAEMLNGLYEADLGGSVLKKRIARDGQGKSGGFRTLIATNKKDRWFFIYGFAKNERSNIDEDEEEALKKLATSLLLLSDESLAQSESKGKIIEVICDAEEKISDS
jgi:hypothetical protein